MIDAFPCAGLSTERRSGCIASRPCAKRRHGAARLRRAAASAGITASTAMASRTTSSRSTTAACSAFRPSTTRSVARPGRNVVNVLAGERAPGRVASQLPGVARRPAVRHRLRAVRQLSRLAADARRRHRNSVRRREPRDGRRRVVATAHAPLDRRRVGHLQLRRAEPRAHRTRGPPPHRAARRFHTRDVRDRRPRVRRRQHAARRAAGSTAGWICVLDRERWVEIDRIAHAVRRHVRLIELDETMVRALRNRLSQRLRTRAVFGQLAMFEQVGVHAQAHVGRRRTCCPRDVPREHHRRSPRGAHGRRRRSRDVSGREAGEGSSSRRRRIRSRCAIAGSTRTATRSAPERGNTRDCPAPSRRTGRQLIQSARRVAARTGALHVTAHAAARKRLLVRRRRPGERGVRRRRRPRTHRGGGSRPRREHAIVQDPGIARRRRIAARRAQHQPAQHAGAGQRDGDARAREPPHRPVRHPPVPPRAAGTAATASPDLIPRRTRGARAVATSPQPQKCRRSYTASQNRPAVTGTLHLRCHPRTARARSGIVHSGGSNAPVRPTIEEAKSGSNPLNQARG